MCKPISGCSGTSSKKSKTMEVLKKNLLTSEHLSITIEGYTTYDIRPIRTKFSISESYGGEPLCNDYELDDQQVFETFKIKKIIEILTYEKDEDGYDDEIVLFK